MKRAACTLALLAACLSGCVTTQPEAITRVPVAADCPTPRVPNRPSMPALTPGMTPQQQIDTLRQALTVCAAYSKGLEEALSGYKND